MINEFYGTNRPSAMRIFSNRLYLPLIFRRVQVIRILLLLVYIPDRLNDIVLLSFTCTGPFIVKNLFM